MGDYIDDLENIVSIHVDSLYFNKEVKFDPEVFRVDNTKNTQQ